MCAECFCRRFGGELAHCLCTLVMIHALCRRLILLLQPEDVRWPVGSHFNSEVKLMEEFRCLIWFLKCLALFQSANTISLSAPLVSAVVLLTALFFTQAYIWMQVNVSFNACCFFILFLFFCKKAFDQHSSLDLTWHPGFIHLFVWLSSYYQLLCRFAECWSVQLYKTTRDSVS